MATTDETADQVAKAELALEAAKAEHAAALATEDDNRPAGDHVIDLLDAIVMRLGNRPDFRAMLTRIRTKIGTPAPAPPSDSEAKAA
jgi:hypothetical protein